MAVGSTDGQTEYVPSRIPYQRSEIVMMSALLLPGTAVVYYGDELGVADTEGIPCELTRDPYALPPTVAECPQGSYPPRSRDPARTPMQWDNSTNAGFTTNKTSWLPVSESYEEFNVEYEQAREHSKLNLFKTIMRIRNENPFYYGEVFYPYHDKNVFSFMRKQESDDIGVLIVINISGTEVEVDFTSILPWMPTEAVVRAATSKHNEEPRFHEGDEIGLAEVRLEGYEGVIMELDFASAE